MMDGWTVWQLIGVGYVLLGVALLISRRLRNASARNAAEFHRRWSRRLPWAYWPKRSSEWTGDEDTWRGLTIIGGFLFIAIGIFSIVGIGQG
jgi:hypothetical protein